MSERLATIKATLDEHRQGHLLRFWDELDVHQRTALLDQIEAIDFTELDRLIDEYVRHPVPAEIPASPEPAPYYAVDPAQGGTPYDPAPYREAGVEQIRAGRVAVLTVAGGQGTRLGWNGPKGTYPATVVTGKPLFRCLAEQILATEKRYQVTVPWYIMTSPINDEATRNFFEDNNCFGLERKNIFMFPQGVMPSLDAKTGDILLAEKGLLAVNPDGHGGSIRALRESGALEDMRGRGITQVSYVQIDNPLVRVVDPLFLGLHVSAPDSSGEMSSKMVAKTDPAEKVGVFCHADGKTMVIEYSDLPEELAHQRDDDGRLCFNAGSIAIHLISVDLVEQLTADPHRFALPFHRAVKKAPYVDTKTGNAVNPAEPNAVKLETFVFDAIPFAGSSIVLETERVEEFAPIKNAEGTDSPATSHQLQSTRNARWLEANNVRVARDEAGDVSARIEISPLTALEPADLAELDLPSEIEAGAEMVL